MNLYTRLGLNKEATPEEIRQAFLELAKKHHPDVGGDEEKFKKIKDAYDILSNPENRKAYDEVGTIPGTKEFEIYNILVQAFRNKVTEACNNRRGISVNELRNENNAAINMLKKQIEDATNSLTLLESISQSIIHKKSRKSKFNAYQKACDLIEEDLKGIIATSKKSLERAILVKEQLDFYEDIKRKQIQFMYRDDGSTMVSAIKRRMF